MSEEAYTLFSIIAAVLLIESVFVIRFAALSTKLYGIITGRYPEKLEEMSQKKYSLMSLSKSKKLDTLSDPEVTRLGKELVVRFCTVLVVAPVCTIGLVAAILYFDLY